MTGADDDLTRARAELGEPEALFHVSPGWLRTKTVVAGGLLLYGVVANYLWWVHGPQNFHHVVIHFLLWPPGVGIALLVHMYRNRGLHVLVYPAGLLRLRHGEVDSYPWAEVEQVKVRAKRADAVVLVRGPDGELTASWLPVDVPTVQVWNAGITLVRSDGQEAHLGPALADYPVLAEEVQRRTFEVLWPAARDRFRAGEVVPFGDLEVTPAGLRHDKKALPWRELQELTVAQGRLTVKQTGRWLPWVLLDVSAVPNPHVLFALVDEARRSHPFLKGQPQPEGADHGSKPEY